MRVNECDIDWLDSLDCMSGNISSCDCDIPTRGGGWERKIRPEGNISEKGRHLICSVLNTGDNP